MTPSSLRSSPNGHPSAPPGAPEDPRDRGPSLASICLCISGLILGAQLLDLVGQSLGYDTSTTSFLLLHIGPWTMLPLISLFALWRFVRLCRRARRCTDESGGETVQSAEPADSSPPPPPPRSRGLVTLGFGVTAFGSLAAALYSVVHLVGWAPEPDVWGRADQSIAPTLATMLLTGIASTFVLLGFIVVHGGRAGGLQHQLGVEAVRSSDPIILDAMLAHRFLRSARLTRRLAIACLGVSWCTILVSLRLTALDQEISAGWRLLESPFTVARIGTLIGTPALLLLAVAQGAMWTLLWNWRRAHEGRLWRLRDLEAANRPRFL